MGAKIAVIREHGEQAEGLADVPSAVLDSASPPGETVNGHANGDATKRPHFPQRTRRVRGLPQPANGQVTGGPDGQGVTGQPPNSADPYLQATALEPTDGRRPVSMIAPSSVSDADAEARPAVIEHAALHEHDGDPADLAPSAEAHAGAAEPDWSLSTSSIRAETGQEAADVPATAVPAWEEEPHDSVGALYEPYRHEEESASNLVVSTVPLAPEDEPTGFLDVPYTPPEAWEQSAPLPEPSGLTFDEPAIPIPTMPFGGSPPGEPPVSTAVFAPAPPPPPSADEEVEEEGATMTIIEHLEELRMRLIWALGAIAAGSLVGWFLTPWAIEQIKRPLVARGVPLYSPTAFGPFVLQIKMALILGTIFAAPMLLYQIWAFVAPGLTRREIRYARPFVLLGSLLFLAGAATGFFIFPLGISFALNFFGPLGIQALLDVNKYVTFIGILMVLFGITFELPVFLVFLSLIGIVSSQGLAQRRRAAFVIIFAVSMVITPGADMVSPLVLGVILCILYESSIWLSKAVGK